MKKILIATLMLAALLLAACSSASGPTQAGALSAQSELLLGSLKLEGTGQAVTKAQAAELLPLWQTMSELQSSASSAPQEKNALLAQIRSAMTPGQLQAITGMKLTSQDAFSFMQEQNISVSGAQTASNTTQSQNNSGGPGGGPAGGPPPGGDPMMGGITGAGGSAASQSQSSAQTVSVQTAGASQISSGLMDALI